MKRIFPSLIASDILHLQDVITQLDPFCSGLHIDIMDYQFVPNLTWGPMFANAIRDATHNRIWVDLLVEHPEKYINDLQLAHGDMVTFHIESRHTNDIVDRIRNNGYHAGVGINPDTPLDHIKPYLADVDHILLMSVPPGFSGQDFVTTSVQRLQDLIAIRHTNNYQFTIAMDGGIDAHNIQKLAHIGADIFAIGSGIFGASNHIQELQRINALVTSTI